MRTVHEMPELRRAENPCCVRRPEGDRWSGPLSAPETVPEVQMEADDRRAGSESRPAEAKSDQKGRIFCSALVNAGWVPRTADVAGQPTFWHLRRKLRECRTAWHAQWRGEAGASELGCLQLEWQFRRELQQFHNDFSPTDDERSRSLALDINRRLLRAIEARLNELSASPVPRDAAAMTND